MWALEIPIFLEKPANHYSRLSRRTPPQSALDELIVIASSTFNLIHPNGGFFHEELFTVPWVVSEQIKPQFLSLSKRPPNVQYNRSRTRGFLKIRLKDKSISSFPQFPNGNTKNNIPIHPHISTKLTFEILRATNL